MKQLIVGSQGELQDYCMCGEGLPDHYIHFHLLLTFYHVSLLCCNVTIKTSEEIIANIFNDTPFLGVNHHLMV